MPRSAAAVPFLYFGGRGERLAAVHGENTRPSNPGTGTALLSLSFLPPAPLSISASLSTSLLPTYLSIQYKLHDALARGAAGIQHRAASTAPVRSRVCSPARATVQMRRAPQGDNPTSVWASARSMPLFKATSRLRRRAYMPLATSVIPSSSRGRRMPRNMPAPQAGSEWKRQAYSAITSSSRGCCAGRSKAAG